MLRIIPATAVLAACVLAAPAGARADEPVTPAPAAPAGASILNRVLARAWEPASTTVGAAVRTQSRRRPVAGPNIESVGLGAVGGLSEFELGPSFRYWATERFGLQAHLGFGGEDDLRRGDVQYMRFEPTFITSDERHQPVADLLYRFTRDGQDGLLVRHQRHLGKHLRPQSPVRIRHIRTSGDRSRGRINHRPDIGNDASEHLLRIGHHPHLNAEPGP